MTIISLHRVRSDDWRPDWDHLTPPLIGQTGAVRASDWSSEETCQLSILHLFGVCLVTMCVMIYCPHYLTSPVTPANQCVITVIIVIMFLQTRYTWRHTRPHLMTITTSFLQQMILVRRYFNQIISILSSLILEQHDVNNVTAQSL